MSAQIKDGGPAFPAEGPSVGQFESYGMNLRDYFAAKAMQGLSANPDEQFTGASFEKIAEFSYRQADAMLAAREVHS